MQLRASKTAKIHIHRYIAYYKHSNVTKYSKVATFEGSFESNTFIYALLPTKLYNIWIMSFMISCIYSYSYFESARHMLRVTSSHTHLELTVFGLRLQECEKTY